MERETVKHGWREDEDLKHGVASLIHGAPVESRSRLDRLQEDPGDGTVIDPGTRFDLPEPGELSDQLREVRAELSRLLTGLHYPACRDEVVAVAARNGAGEALQARLASLPDGPYEIFEAVWEALGGPPDPPER
jgi:hypothetical protein